LIKKNNHYKTSWYDGWFYSNVLDRIGGEENNRAIINILPEGCSVIEIGCGTGYLSYQLSVKCSRVTGVDTSPKMIDFARKVNSGGKYTNLDFQLIGKDSILTDEFVDKFDFALIKMVLHENEPHVRDLILQNIIGVASQAIIADWVYPLPGGLTGFVSNAIEFIAGREHFRNFRQWCSTGGIMGFVESKGLQVLEYKDYSSRTGRIVRVGWDD